MTVASRSVRQTRGVPPCRRSTASIASIRCGWSSDSASTPRIRPECGSVPSSTYAVPPHGAFRRSNQSHCISSPAGWAISIVSRPDTPAHGSQCGRRPASRNCRAKLT